MDWEEYAEEMGEYHANLDCYEMMQHEESVKDWADGFMARKGGKYVVASYSRKNNEVLYYRYKDERTGSFWTKYPTSAFFYNTQKEAQAVANRMKYNRPHVRRINHNGQVAKLT